MSQGVRALHAQRRRRRQGLAKPRKLGGRQKSFELFLRILADAERGVVRADAASDAEIERRSPVRFLR
jgi:hypothetical protein